MPVCKKCNSPFPNRVTIESKVRNFSNRKYCLNCSPFDKHNTTKLELCDSEDKHIRACKRCHKNFRVDNSRGNKGFVCNSCRSNLRKTRVKKELLDYKGGECIKCGYDKCIASLDFHHLDPNSKEFSISGRHCLSIEKLKREVDKCIILCKNCHNELHYLEKQKK